MGEVGATAPNQRWNRVLLAIARVSFSKKRMTAYTSVAGFSAAYVNV